VTEMDIDGNPTQNPNLTPEASDQFQLQEYQRIFPALWEHPAVEGITLWGWRVGMWRTAQEAYLIRPSGHERPALEWLRGYLSEPAFAVDIEHVKFLIGALPDAAVRHPAANRKATLINKLNEVLALIEAGLYADAAKKLEKDILQKLGTGNPNNNWVTDPAAQAELQPLIFSLIERLEAEGALASRSADTQAEALSDLPATFAVSRNYPNPFNPTTTIRYQIPSDERVTLTVYNVLGQMVRTLVDQHQTAGYYSVIWDGRNESGVELGSGTYFYSIRAGEFGEVKSMVYIK
jgi:hypothetical protein